MRGIVGLMFIALLSVDVLPCGGSSEPPVRMVGLGDTCGGYTSQPRECVSQLTCCVPDPRIADDPGTCVQDSDLSQEGEVCGVTTGRCCAAPLHCEVQDPKVGDGVCVP